MNYVIAYISQYTVLKVLLTELIFVGLFLWQLDQKVTISFPRMALLSSIFPPYIIV